MSFVSAGLVDGERRGGTVDEVTETEEEHCESEGRGELIFKRYGKRGLLGLGHACRA